MMEKLTKFVTSHPFVLFIILAILVGVFGVIPIKIWSTTSKNITNTLDLISEDLVSEIKNIGKFIYPNANSSTIGLARVINSYYLTSNTEIAPVLFQAYSTIPQVSQVSYISTDGLLFSYITELNRSVAVFTNSSSGSRDYTCYTQPVDQITGRLTGNATKSQPVNVTDTHWYQAAQRNETTSFVGTSFVGDDSASLFQTVVNLYSTKGVVSLGFPLKTLSDFLNSLNLHGGEIYVWTQNETLLVHEGSLNAPVSISNGLICFGGKSKPVRSQCVPRKCSSGSYKVEIEKSKFQAFCSVLEVSGVPLRYTLILPNKGEGTSIKNATLYMLIVTIVIGLCWPLGFVMFMVRAARKEMHMRVTLINQMEATQQAERKSMNKSEAFASATHDIRGSLRGITGMIDLCRGQVRPGSELDKSLKQMNDCTEDLYGLLNSVLDMGQIENGKMHLSEEEFNLAQLLEDVIDFFHPGAMKNGVDVVLDLPDGSIFKYWNVIGDGGKLKQILNNLVSNAVKFTVDGHISIRAWAQRPGSKKSVILASSSEPRGRGRFSKCIFCLSKDQSPSAYDVETANSIRNNANTMEFVFEVDDTGKGIPMEMRKSVFENYVQVRETAKGQQGTGLGLGIVQSLVRLMGGEIRIMDKAMGEKGTCFRFNVLLTTLESSVNETKHDIESGGEYVPTPNLGLTINTSMGSSSRNLRNLSPRFNTCLTSSPKQESSVVLLLKDEERRRVTERYIKGFNIKVSVVEKWEHLSQVLERLFGYSPQSSMRSEVSSTRTRELPLLGNNDGVDSRSQVLKRRSNSFPAVVLLVIDAKAGPMLQMSDIVEQFRKSLYHGISCKVVWLNGGPTLEREDDIIYLKPLHGSRLNRVLKMLPEFGGTMAKEAPIELPKYTNSEIQEEEPSSSSRSNKNIGKSTMAPISSENETKGKSVRTKKDGILSGKRVLVVDDRTVTCRVATRILESMGVSEAKECNSGEEAVRLVSERLTQDPFDYIFMDCQMPGMDGYEATREIRKMEKKFGVHTPILALSAHDHGSPEAQEAIKAGMDAFLGKTVNKDLLVNIIKELESKMSLDASL